MITAHDLRPPDATRVRSAETTVDAAREAASSGVGALPGRGPDEKPTGMLADRRVAVGAVGAVRAVRAVTQGMPPP
ncbi:hypothetical protein ACFV5J_34165 [Streptomyces zaomyceticus]|uniref:hypothetical protein n=1 Tax=Streptomyces zaomyceticus TaxID=68286 RepID=UPI00364868B8